MREPRQKVQAKRCCSQRAAGDEAASSSGIGPRPSPVSNYWSLAPAARFIMIDFDADKWRATRLTFRGGWCAAHADLPDCRVPLAFDADDAWHDAAVAVATANQTAAAALSALKAFLRCTIPADSSCG